MDMKKQILELYNAKKNYYTKYIKQDEKMKKYLNKYFYWSADMKEQVYCLRHNIRKQPICKYKGCMNTANFKGQTEGYGVGGCSRQHGQFISNLVKFGVEMPFQKKEILEKTYQTMEDNFGHRNPGFNKKSQLKRIRSRFSNKLTASQYMSIRTAFRRLQRITDNLLKPRVLRDEQSIKIKREKTLIAHYGVSNPMQSSIIAEKHLGGYKTKKYVWKTGESSILQGYEPIVLKELEDSGYKYGDVLTKKSDMPEVWYVGEDNKKHRYYADFYIPTENLIIEVKSDYTMLKEFYKNQLKAVATKTLGYNYKLEVR